MATSYGEHVRAAAAIVAEQGANLGYPDEDGIDPAEALKQVAGQLAEDIWPYVAGYLERGMVTDSVVDAMRAAAARLDRMDRIDAATLADMGY